MYCFLWVGGIGAPGRFTPFCDFTCPPTMTVPSRAAVAEFGSSVNVRVALPLPVVVARWIHDSDVDAVQLQSVVRATVAVGVVRGSGT